MDEKLFTPLMASEYLGLSLPTLASYRTWGRGPAYIKIGRSVRYRIVDLNGFLAKMNRPAFVWQRKPAIERELAGFARGQAAGEEQARAATAAPVPSGDILDTAGAAQCVGLAVSTLEKMRCTGNGPKFLKLGRAVRYRRADLTDWLNSHLAESTSEPR